MWPVALPWLSALKSAHLFWECPLGSIVVSLASHRVPCPFASGVICLSYLSHLLRLLAKQCLPECLSPPSPTYGHLPTSSNSRQLAPRTGIIKGTLSLQQAPAPCNKLIQERERGLLWLNEQSSTLPAWRPVCHAASRLWNITLLQHTVPFSPSSSSSGHLLLVHLLFGKSHTSSRPCVCCLRTSDELTCECHIFLLIAIHRQSNDSTKTNNTTRGVHEPSTRQPEQQNYRQSSERKYYQGKDALLERVTQKRIGERENFKVTCRLANL